MRDHGGDLDRAKAHFGGTDWIDLSTGINPVSYPIPAIAARAFTDLPTSEDLAELECAARLAYGTVTGLVAVGGAQAAIQLVPRLRKPGRAKVLAPTYNEHAASFAAQGWDISEAADIDSLTGADIAVVVNPNNPDGQSWTPEALTNLSTKVGLLVVDESFADPHPELSLVPSLDQLGERVLILRSFGKFYGLAGVRLGFALGGEETLARLKALSGPWAVSGPAIAIACAALADEGWKQDMIARLKRDSERLDQLATQAGWSLVGGSALFRTYETGDSVDAHDRLAQTRIWTRIFPYSRTWIRMGLPGKEIEWSRLKGALLGSGQ